MKNKVTIESEGKPKVFFVTEEQAKALILVLEVFQGFDSDSSFEITGVTRVYVENVSLKTEENETSYAKGH